MIEFQVTNLELSKRLKELGIKQQSLFFWEWFNDSCYGVKYFPYTLVPGDANEFKIYSAFTASELSHYLPYSYQKNGTSHYIETMACILNGEYHTICESHWYEVKRDSIAICGDQFDGEGNEANARARMLIYLIENKFIEV